MLSEHATQLKDSVSDFVARATDLKRVRALRGTPQEYDRGLWKQMAALGWLGIAIPETYGGMGLGLTETAVVAQGLARALTPEPYTACAVLASGALAYGTNEDLKHEFLPAAIAGERALALAWQEAPGALDTNHIAMRATPFEGGFRLSGCKRYVCGAAGADVYLVAARADEGLVLACIERDAPGTKVDFEPLADGRHFGTLALDDAVVPREKVAATGAAASAAIERALDHAAAIVSAELYAVMSRALEMSVDYMKTRVQFGRPIGSFQALQHRAVDLYIQQELASAVLEESLAALDAQPEPARRAVIVSRLKARCSDAAVRITREAIQIHGAIGFTDEYDAGLYLKRALVLAAWLGSATQHRRRYAALAIAPERAHAG
ncbi:MAG TPA: acyl-CoA dehydrogenase family protein [Burkholderiales bacterium]|nr:acyl-CoA dehydrogenase family protein [Burkholderiales bacterium]